jgi:hypothetical protein
LEVAVYLFYLPEGRGGEGPAEMASARQRPKQTSRGIRMTLPGSPRSRTAARVLVAAHSLIALAALVDGTATEEFVVARFVYGFEMDASAL